uniref:Uncharacterized protein n=1 Tax=Anguilla anguilla TaxID=7936 RepID=A0A0E9U9L0_ANGAN
MTILSLIYHYLKMPWLANLTAA